MLFVLNLINTYEQTLIETKNKHFGGRTHEVVNMDELDLKHSSNIESNIYSLMSQRISRKGV